MSKCPKCGEKISPFYIKQNCPKCNVDLLYYQLDERLEADANETKRQVDNINRFVGILKSSSVASPWLIIRLVLFFTPLASMCLPMYNEYSLISIIIKIIDGELVISDCIFPIVSMALVIFLSLAVIISSLFSVTAKGFLRNMILSGINTAVFVVLGIIIGGMQLGWYITLVIYIAEIILHIICNNVIKGKKNEEVTL